MRRALTLCLIALAVAGPAGAQQKARPKVPPASAGSSATAGLRGPLPTAPPSRYIPPPPAIDLSAQAIFQPAPIASAPVGGAPQQCRLSCAQAYYFCLAGEAAETCSGSWGQCRSGCDAPTLTTSY